MLSRKMIKRGLASALVFAAAGSPAAAHASFAMVAPAGASAAAHISTAPAARQVGSGFQWGDAGIGAAVAITVLGAGAASSGAARRRRTHRAVLG